MYERARKFVLMVKIPNNKQTKVIIFKVFTLKLLVICYVSLAWSDNAMCFSFVACHVMLYFLLYERWHITTQASGTKQDRYIKFRIFRYILIIKIPNNK